MPLLRSRHPLRADLGSPVAVDFPEYALPYQSVSGGCTRGTAPVKNRRQFQSFRAMFPEEHSGGKIFYRPCSGAG